MQNTPPVADAEVSWDTTILNLPFPVVVTFPAEDELVQATTSDTIVIPVIEGVALAGVSNPYTWLDALFNVPVISVILVRVDGYVPLLLAANCSPAANACRATAWFLVFRWLL